MAESSIDLDPRLLTRARELTGARSVRAVVDLALRRLIALKLKGSMIDGILNLNDVPDQLGAPTVSYPSSAS